METLYSNTKKWYKIILKLCTSVSPLLYSLSTLPLSTCQNQDNMKLIFKQSKIINHNFVLISAFQIKYNSINGNSYSKVLFKYNFVRSMVSLIKYHSVIVNYYYSIVKKAGTVSLSPSFSAHASVCGGQLKITFRLFHFAQWQIWDDHRSSVARERLSLIQSLSLLPLSSIALLLRVQCILWTRDFQVT